MHYDIPSRKTIGFSGGFGNSPAAPMTINVCPYAVCQSRVDRAYRAYTIESLSTYLLGAHFLPICVILTVDNASAYKAFSRARRTYLQYTTLDHDFHTVWWNARYLVYRILEHGWGLIGIELYFVDLSSMLDLHCERCHYFTNMFSGLSGEGERGRG